MSLIEKISALFKQRMQTSALRILAGKPRLSSPDKELAGMLLAPENPKSFYKLIRDMDRHRSNLASSASSLRAAFADTPDERARHERNALVWELKGMATYTQDLTKDFTDLAAIRDSKGNTAESLAVASGNEDMLRIIKAARVIRAIQMMPAPQPK